MHSAIIFTIFVAACGGPVAKAGVTIIDVSAKPPVLVDGSSVAILATVTDKPAAIAGGNLRDASRRATSRSPSSTATASEQTRYSRWRSHAPRRDALRRALGLTKCCAATAAKTKTFSLRQLVHQLRCRRWRRVHGRQMHRRDLSRLHIWRHLHHHLRWQRPELLRRLHDNEHQLLLVRRVISSTVCR
jgi:hypothetical protein